MNKDRHIISELNSFFAESNNTKAIQGIMNVMSPAGSGRIPLDRDPRLEGGPVQRCAGEGLHDRRDLSSGKPGGGVDLP